MQNFYTLKFSIRFYSLIIFLTSFALHSNAQVTANFSGTPIAGCAPLTVQFTDLSTGNPTSWNWAFGNGNNSTLQNPAATYANPGVYTVVLTASNGSSTNTKTITSYINVYNKPIASFTMSNDTVCVGSTAVFTDASTISSGGAAITKWDWDFGDGNTTTTLTGTTSHAYTNAGTFPVTLIITDANGCTNSVIINIVVIPKPTVNFTANPTSSCTAPLTVNFTNTSTTIAGATYFWKFGDGSTSTLSSPTHTYTALGLYTVTLIINQNGCIDSLKRINYIQIQAIAAGFTATPVTGCAGQNVTFTNTSIPSAVAAFWTFGDGGTSGNINPAHVYNNPGVYSVTLIVSDGSGCKDTLTQNNFITIDTTPVANFSPNNISTCKFPVSVNFTNSSTGASSWDWSFGDGGTSTSQNPSHTYNNAGTNTVTLIVANSNNTCFDTISKTNFITYSPPVAAFSAQPDSGCVPLNVVFTDNSTSSVSSISTYYWNYGDGTLDTTSTPGSTHTYTVTGIFTITYIVETANGCRDTVVCTNCIKVGTKPTATFGIVDDTVCYGMPVTFVDSSTGNVTGWFWQFGDGSTSPLQNPVHIYGQPGNYNAYLIAYNNGCPDTSVIKPVVIDPPKAIFNKTQSCTNYYTVLFQSTSIGADSLVWNFGDGNFNTANVISPSHTYLARGNYTVTLTAYNYSSGCTNSMSINLTIAEPIASFTQNAPKGCFPFNVSFNSTSQDANTYSWTFGNGNTSSSASPTTTYINAGAYNVTLIITDVNGCKDTVTALTTAYGPTPYFYADTTHGCTPLNVTFVDTTVSDSTLVQWIWNFGDGTIDTVFNDSVSHIYTTPGVYTVTMTVKDTNGCTKVITINNYIRPTFPQPAFTVDTFACKGDILTFNASGTVVAGGIYIWNYGDGTIDTTANNTITHTYSKDSLFNVTLTVVDSNGCDSTISLNVLIQKPTANFGWNIINSGCGTLQVAFTDSSANQITAWQWAFGNGASSVLQNPTYTYTAPGIYGVTLIVTNGGGCKDTLKLDSIIVVAGPIGTFTFAPTTGCIPLEVTFIANSNNSQQYIWDFGDGNVINGNDTIVHTYTYAGNFTPILVLQNTLSNGTPCLLPATNLTGSVTPTNAFNVNIGPSYISVPEDSTFIITPTVGATMYPTYNWSPSTGINCPTCQNIILTGPGSGDSIMYYFTVIDSNGCQGRDSVLVYSAECVKQKLIPNVFTPDGDGVNDHFYIPGVCSSEDYTLEIYDRWGLKIFTTSYRQHRWDGRTMAGKDAPDGTYYYIITVFEKSYKGFVQLIR